MWLPTPTFSLATSNQGSKKGPQEPPKGGSNSVSKIWIIFVSPGIAAKMVDAKFRAPCLNLVFSVLIRISDLPKLDPAPLGYGVDRRQGAGLWCWVAGRLAWLAQDLGLCQAASYFLFFEAGVAARLSYLAM